MMRIWIFAAALLVLTGCAAQPTMPETPSPPTSTAAAPTSTAPTYAENEPSALVLSSGVITVVDASGTVLDQVAFDRPVSEVVDLIENTLGLSPTLTQSDESQCTDARGVSYYLWQDYAVTVIQESQPSGQATWREAGAYSFGFGATSVGGIDLRGTDGVRVGDDATALVGSVPEDYIDQVSGSAVWAITEAGGPYVNTLGSREWGLGAIVDNGIVTSWLAPGYVLDKFC